MFSENQKISMRQTFRLFSYDLIGMSTLLLPTFLADYAGCDGIFAIFIGTLAALCYVTYLNWVIRGMGNDLLTYCKEAVPVLMEKLVLVWLLFQAVIVAGYTAYVFANLMNKSLLKEETFWLVLIVSLAIAGYGIIGEMEGRARIYEVLFWFILIPLVLMLISAGKEVDTDYWTPIFTSDIWSTAQASYLVFIFFGTVSWMLLMSGYVKKEDREHRLARSIKCAVIFAAVVLASLYLLLLGTFGNGALANMDYPAVTFMSTVQITGGFLKRADALMQGVWFFTLFALLNTNLFYGMTVLKEFVGLKGKKRYMLILLAATFAVAALFYLSKECGRLFIGYWRYAGMPLLILVPGSLLLFGRKHNKGGAK